MQKENKEKEFVYEMTQEEYDKGLAKGWDADDMLSVGKHKFRRLTWADKMKSCRVEVLGRKTARRILKNVESKSRCMLMPTF